MVPYGKHILQEKRHSAWSFDFHSIVHFSAWSKKRRIVLDSWAHKTSLRAPYQILKRERKREREKKERIQYLFDVSIVAEISHIHSFLLFLLYLSLWLHTPSFFTIWRSWLIASDWSRLFFIWSLWRSVVVVWITPSGTTFSDQIVEMECNWQPYQ
jgi:hypothetical protein